MSATGQGSAQTKIIWRPRGTNNDMPDLEKILSQAVVIGKSVYIGGWQAEHEVYQYQWYPKDGMNMWKKLPRCPVKFFGLAKFMDSLLAVGGILNGDSPEVTTNEIHRLNEEKQEWGTKYLPPMLQARSSPTVVSTYDFSPGRAEVIAVCGGISNRPLESEKHTCDTVEVYSCAASQWHQASPLPSPCYWMSSVTIGDTCYLLGGNRVVGRGPGIDKCFSADLRSLTDKAISGANSPDEWKSITTPLTWSTAACLKGSLIAIGGQDTDGKDSPAIHLLKSDGKTWERMEGGDMPLSCQRPTVVCLPSGELLVVGVSKYEVLLAAIIDK